jgi:hypothetical protein
VATVDAIQDAPDVGAITGELRPATA